MSVMSFYAIQDQTDMRYNGKLENSETVQTDYRQTLIN